MLERIATPPRFRLSRQSVFLFLLALLLALSFPVTAAEEPPNDDGGADVNAVWNLHIVSWNLGPPSSAVLFTEPDPIPCLPCAIEHPGHTEVPMPESVNIDVSESGPVREPLTLAGIYLGTDQYTYTFDLSRDPLFLAYWAEGLIGQLVIDNPPPDLENKSATLRVTWWDRYTGVLLWIEKGLVWRK